MRCCCFLNGLVCLHIYTPNGFFFIQPNAKYIRAESQKRVEKLKEQIFCIQGAQSEILQSRNRFLLGQVVYDKIFTQVLIILRARQYKIVNSKCVGMTDGRCNSRSGPHKSPSGVIEQIVQTDAVFFCFICSAMH